MNTLTNELQRIKAKNARVSEDTLMVDLTDGRTISIPLAWFPRLLHASAEERSNWRMIGANDGIHWKDIDEDISVENLILGKPSGESQRSFKRWLKERLIRQRQS